MYKVVVRIRSQLDQLGSAFQENITLTGHTKDLNKISVESFQSSQRTACARHCVGLTIKRLSLPDFFNASLKYNYLILFKTCLV